MPSGVAGGDGVYGRSMNVSLTWLKRLRCRRLALIHIGVVVLVAGALVSFFAGEYGHICLRQDGGNAAMWKVGGQLSVSFLKRCCPCFCVRVCHMDLKLTGYTRLAGV